MTPEETRQLGIEFERRVQTMIPEKEYLYKLDTETIYSFLNQYQDKYVHDIYRSLDNIPSGSKLSAHIESVLQSLLRRYEVSITEGQTSTTNITDPNDISIVDTARSYTFELPTDFYMYIRSVSKVSETYSFKGHKTDEGIQAISILPNQLISQSEVWKLVETPHNTLRILRNPAAILNVNNTLTVMFDRYTTIEGISILYYKEPQHFDLMTSTPCELPMDAFDDIVTGAVDLYVQYVAGAEARKRQMDEAARKAQRSQDNKED